MSTATLSSPTEDDLDQIFMALANRTRRHMLVRLGQGPATVSDLADPFDMSLPGASKHVRVLEQAGLVLREIDGRIHRCSLDPEPLEHADAWLTETREFWKQQLQSLADHFTESESDESSS